ncbi:unnamed protein product [Toxocara canis]|uniref:Uncharacterized protein n=1 Tax=Toxocara canis TaxID=6265 RepID=A0A183TW67_TOXCA|nr:unnamed protein product [Toxocara canis]
MVAGTGFIAACAIGAYIYLTNKEKKGTQLSEGSKHKEIHLEKQLVEDIIRKLRAAEDAASSPRVNFAKLSKQKGPATNAVQPQPAIVYQYPYAPNGPLMYPNAPVFYQQPNVPPGVMIQPSSPVVWPGVQMAPTSSSRWPNFAFGNLWFKKTLDLLNDVPKRLELCYDHAIHLSFCTSEFLNGWSGGDGTQKR